MKDLSTLEYLYVRRCCSASSEMHSCLAVSVQLIVVSYDASAQGGRARTFARRHSSGSCDGKR
jgi:hypothetical protein